MMKSFLVFLVQILIVVSLFGCRTPSSTPAPTPTPTPTATPPELCTGPAITVGQIDNNPTKLISDTQPMVKYLAEHLEEFGIKCGQSKITETVDEMILAIDSGEVDIYMDSIYPAALVNDATGAQPILLRLRDCNPDYYSVIFTTVDSGITRIEDLPDHMIAMDRPDSTSGFIFPAVYLMDHGLKLVVKESYADAVAADEVGIYFSEADPNTLVLVNYGYVAAGATDDWNFGNWDKEAPGTLVKLAETESMPRQAVLVRPDLGSDLQAAITEVLANAHLNEVGLEALKQAADTCEFNREIEGIKAAIPRLLEMHLRIQEIPGWQEANDRLTSKD